MTIPGGYYLKARKIKDGWVAHSSPCIREVWDYLLREANDKENGVCKRGQLLRSYADIIEDLRWYVGYRKKVYSVSACERAMKALTKERMIATTKATRGLLITICNYDTYQKPENYEGQSEGRNKATTRPEEGQTINKNGRMEERENEKKENKRRFTPPSAQEVAEYAKSINFDLNGQDFIDHYEANGWMRGKTRVQDWKACVRTWKANRAQNTHGTIRTKDDAPQRGETRRLFADPDGQYEGVTVGDD